MFLAVLGGAVCSQGVLVTMATDLGHSLASGPLGVSGVWRCSGFAMRIIFNNSRRALITSYEICIVDKAVILL